MNYRKPTYLAFYLTAFISLLVAILFEKKDLLYIFPLTFVTIFVLYITEKKESINILFVLALIFGLVGGIFLLIGFGQYVPEVSIFISLFYLIYLRLMYVKNEKIKATPKIYFKLVLIFLPIIYIYDRVICLVYDGIRDEFIYFAVMAFFMLSYIIAVLYYYLKNKNQSNLWMLIVAANLGIMNIIIMINELYMYERMFTVLAIFCSNFTLFFSLKFMLETDENNVSTMIE